MPLSHNSLHRVKLPDSGNFPDVMSGRLSMVERVVGGEFWCRMGVMETGSEPREGSGSVEGSYRGKGKGSNPSSHGNLRRWKERLVLGEIEVPKKRVLEVVEEDELEAMRWVMSRPAEEDRTYQQREMRVWQRDSPSEFRRAWAALKKAALAAGASVSAAVWPGGGTEVERVKGDVGVERLMELLEVEWEELRLWKASRRG